MTTTAAEIAHHAHGFVVGSPDAVVTSWAFDSRALEPGACFVALRGEGDRDGHDFVPDAFGAGASVALVSAVLPRVTPPPGAALVQVDDVLLRLQELAGAARSARVDLRVVGVVGSTGKTSTKDLLAAVLAPLGCYASPASFNNEFGVPITLLNAPDDAGIVVAEMGERFPGDVAALCVIARPSVGVVTNVGLAHAEHLGGAPGAARAMGELLESLPPGGLAVLNADDEWTPTLVAGTGARVEVVTVGAASGADFRVEDIELDEQLRPSFSIGPQRFRVPLHGEHQVVNAALAVVAAHRGFGVALHAAADALRAARPARWRLELHVTSSGVTVLNDAYNANPASMAAGLRALARIPTAGRRIAVLGDMRELGTHSDDAHVVVGLLVADLGIDVLIAVGPGGRAIADAAAVAGRDIHFAADAGEALALVTSLVAAGDAVLVKASRAVGLERIAVQLIGAPT